MPRTGKSHPPSLKAKVAVEAIKAHKTAAQIAQMFGVHPTQVGGWKKGREGRRYSNIGTYMLPPKRATRLPAAVCQRGVRAAHFPPTPANNAIRRACAN